ncbi:membrane protein insertase YidC [uncultured Acetobacteroides sp.]|uniref:membrane protein insertase YidC n=1 Tax=uncultured Acetobacteroides sp. TaxID=1760811 RepID=UPI0029F4B343|nr:membrane protein insertase YidC [uncultured Acetobacteroides sp.]
MDKKSIIGLVLVGVILIGFSYYNNRQMSKYQKEQAVVDSIAKAKMPKDTSKNEASVVQEQLKQEKAKDSLEVASISEAMGASMASAIKGTEEFYTLQNDRIKVVFSNKGGRIASVEALKYKRYNGDKLVLFTPEKSQFDINLFIGQSISTSKFYFQPVNVGKNGVLSAKDSVKSAVFRLYTDASSYIEYVYTLKKGSYMVDYKVNFVGLEGKLPQNMTSLDINWAMDAPQQEKGFKYENNYTNVAYKFPGEKGDLEELSAMKETGSEKVTTKIQWVDFKQQFFSSILVAKNSFTSGDVSQTTHQPNSGYVKNFKATLQVPFTPATKSIDLAFYFGPNLFNELRKYDMGFETVVPLGSWIIRWINRWVVIPVFDMLESHIASFGIIILILTVLIKLVLFPLTYKSYLSMAKMRVLKPDVDQINAKYPKKEDAMKKQQEVMALYRKTGVNPMGGCLPMLLQMPILFAMFKFFPASFELRQKSFLWADDLSSFDSIVNLPFDIPMYGGHISLFTLLMAVSLYLTSKINTAQMADTNQQMPGMKFMTLYMMPVMMLLWFNNYAAGLSYYYLLSNLITLGQTYFIRQTVDDAAVHAKLKEASKKPVKKSRFQQKLEEMAKQQKKK